MTHKIPACEVIESFDDEYPVGLVILRPQLKWLANKDDVGYFCPLDEDTGTSYTAAIVKGLGAIPVVAEDGA